MKYCFLFCLLSTTVFAQTNGETEKKIQNLYYKLTGTFPKASQVTIYKTYMQQHGIQKLGIEIANERPEFLNNTIKSFVTPFTNQAADHSEPLNDMSALMIGVVRDDLPFTRIFYDDIYYVFKGPQLSNQNELNLKTALTTSGTDINIYSNVSDLPDLKYAASLTTEQRYTSFKASFYGKSEWTGSKILTQGISTENNSYILSLYNPDRNDHFKDADELNIPFLSKSFIRVKQIDYLHNNSKAVSGILSTRAFGKAYLQAGTNRAAVSYVVNHFMCRTMNQMKDNTITDSHVTRDIPRIPGGVAAIYRNDCMTCHTGMDPLTKAFAYHDFVDEKIIYSEGQVRPKLNAVLGNDDSTIGHIVRNDHWINFWRQGLHANMGWGSSTEGYGLKSLGQMFSETHAVAECITKRTIESVCLSRNQKLSSENDAMIIDLQQSFTNSNFNLKELFVSTALRCGEVYE